MPGKTLTKFLLTLAIGLIPATAMLAQMPASPQRLYGPLFEAVQLERVFPDSKTFVDMIPRQSPAGIMADYRAEHPAGRKALADFVARHFTAAEEVDQRRAETRVHEVNA